MAGDTGSWIGNVRHSVPTKVGKSPDGILVGCTGRAGKCVAFLEAVHSSPRHEWQTPVADGDGADFMALVVEDGVITILAAHGVEPVIGSYFAIGSGAEFAMGAMYAGADAEGAVEAAAEHSNYAMLPVMCVRAD